MEAKTLKPCPLCGADQDKLALSQGVNEYWVVCKICDASTRMASNKERAIIYWNNRLDYNHEALIHRLIGYTSYKKPGDNVLMEWITECSDLTIEDIRRHHERLRLN